MSEREIYLVITQTGSIVSRMLKKITGAEYNHISVSLEPDLRCMYSFGRRYTYFPWYGGFVRESTEYGAMKRFSDARAVVLAIPVSESTYNGVEAALKDMIAHKDDYHYDSIGLVLAGFKIIYKRERHYYCSDFVRELLVNFGIEDSGLFEPIVQPMHFLDIPDGNVIYRGRLCDYGGTAVR
ncbi:MAG: hypothetical protein NC299_01185 [Lachnospiraceae bacterium]|nr:hypothetical protein [Ruminococcus sp.]MCM1273962.1 hypothetical protein [Lachnospiraceae bacterium]